MAGGGRLLIRTVRAVCRISEVLMKNTTKGCKLGSLCGPIRQSAGDRPQPQRNRLRVESALPMW